MSLLKKHMNFIDLWFFQNKKRFHKLHQFSWFPTFDIKHTLNALSIYFPQDKDPLRNQLGSHGISSTQLTTATPIRHTHLPVSRSIKNEFLRSIWPRGHTAHRLPPSVRLRLFTAVYFLSTRYRSKESIKMIGGHLFTRTLNDVGECILCQVEANISPGRFTVRRLIWKCGVINAPFERGCGFRKR